MDRNYARNYLHGSRSMLDNRFNSEFGFCEEIRSNTRNLGWQVSSYLDFTLLDSTWLELLQNLPSEFMKHGVQPYQFSVQFCQDKV